MIGTFLAYNVRMSLFALVVYVVLGATLGAAAFPVFGGSKAWSAAAALAGFLGALLGAWIARATSLPYTIHVDGQPFPLLWAFVGALLLVGYCITAQVVVSSRPA
jgi:uncharacterized membrane protein YeaQ/YmgE (transglycosylase-associated protein family)